MTKCVPKYISVLSTLLLIPCIQSAPFSTVHPDPYTIKENNLESTTIKINPSTAPLTELIQLQTNAIKKILSTSIQASQQDLPKVNTKCEDIETGIKESIRKSSVQDKFESVNNFQKDEEVTENEERGDLVTEVVTAKVEKSSPPNGRTLFSSYEYDIARINENVTPQSPIVPENQNIILVPCIKKVVQNETRRNAEQKNEQQRYDLYKNYDPQQPNKQLIHSTENDNKHVLEKVYAPNGYLLYYMYRPRNLSPEQSTADYSTTFSTTPAISTSTTTSSPLENMYEEQLKFVVQMPYANPEQIIPYGFKFDQYAYYPPELQPSYVNGPVEYKPTFHMIRTLVIPNEYINNNNGDYNQQNENMQ